MQFKNSSLGAKRGAFNKRICIYTQQLRLQLLNKKTYF